MQTPKSFQKEALNVPITPEQEESIIKEAMEFQFPSQAQKHYRFLKVSSFVGLAAIALVLILVFGIPHKQNTQEFEIDFGKTNRNFGEFLNSPTIFADAAAAQDSPYFVALKNLAAKRYRYVILKVTDTKGKGKLATGYYESATFADFVDQFTEEDDQVGYVYVGPKGFEQLYLVVYSPKNKDAQEVLKRVNAPGDVKTLAQLGLKDVKMLVASSKEEIQEAQIVADSHIIFAAAIGSEYSGLFKDLAAGKYTWVTLKHNPDDYSKIKVSRGNDKFNKVLTTFEEGKEQATFAWLGSEDDDTDQVVMIIYAPGLTYKTMTKQVLAGFRLPETSKGLDALGLPSTNIYVANKIAKISEQAALAGAKDKAPV